MSERLGIAPGAAAWKWLLAEERDRTDDLVAEVERLRVRVRDLECEDAGRDLMDAEAEGVIDRLEAEVERLTAQLDAVREAWRHETFAAFHPVSGKSGVVYAVTPETVEAVVAALGGDA